MKIQAFYHQKVKISDVWVITIQVKPRKHYCATGSRELQKIHNFEIINNLLETTDTILTHVPDTLAFAATSQLGSY